MRFDSVVTFGLRNLEASKILLEVNAESQHIFVRRSFLHVSGAA